MWFFGALLDWKGDNQPTFDSIGNAKSFRQGTMHIDSIRRTGPMVLGNRPLSLDGIEPWLCINGSDIQSGYDYVRPWKRRDTGKLPTFSHWNDLYIWCLANFHLANYAPPDEEFPILAG
jgi:hypothetical protein